jgi:hypothetical protein
LTTLTVLNLFVSTFVGATLSRVVVATFDLFNNLFDGAPLLKPMASRSIAFSSTREL